MAEDESRNKKLLKSKEYRGEILHHMANLDMLLNFYISLYFCGSNEQKVLDMIILVLGDDRMSLSSKAQVFYYLATKYDKVWYDSYKSPRKHDIKKQPYSLNSDLVYIIEQRNIFAHRLFDNSAFDKKPTSKDAIRFTRFKNAVEGVDFDPISFNTLFQVVTTVTIYFASKMQADFALIKSTLPSA